MGPNKEFQAQVEAYMELQNPIYHTPIDLGISAFKREITVPGISRAFRNKLIKAYKKRAWMQYRGVAKNRGTFPTHPVYGTALEVTGENKETKIKVNNERSKK
jgi:hypothetical protein